MVQDFLLKKRRMKQSISYDQNKIKILCDHLCDKIEPLLDYFGLEYRINPKFITMSCPIHGGDNDSALNLYHTGDTYRGNWKCRSHKCDEIFKGSIIGFIRGVLSHKNHNWTKDGDPACSFNEALEFATEFIDISLKDIKVSNKDKEKNLFVNNTKVLQPAITVKNGVNRTVVRKNLNIPSQYFISRGFNSDILNKYDIGDCITPNKEMTNRAVVPIYDMDYQFMIGCSGRTTFDKCENCKAYHDNICPSDDNRWKFCKWKHSSGFKTQECLYNYWFAKDHIKESGQAILVESPGNVWKLEENNIHNSLGLFGSNLSDKQKTILDMSGAMDLILIMDNDDAGNKARKQIHNKCHRTYNIKDIVISKNDIAEMSSNEIEKEIKRYL